MGAEEPVANEVNHYAQKILRSRIYFIVAAVFLAIIAIIICLRQIWHSEVKPIHKTKQAWEHPLYKQMLCHPWYHYDSALDPGGEHDIWSGWEYVDHKCRFLVSSAKRLAAIQLLQHNPIVKLSYEDATSLLAGTELDRLAAEAEWDARGVPLEPKAPSKFLVPPGYSAYLVRFVTIVPRRLSCPQVEQKEGLVKITLTMQPPEYFVKLQKLPLILVLKTPPTQVYHHCIWTSGCDYSYTTP